MLALQSQCTSFSCVIRLFGLLWCFFFSFLCCKMLTMVMPQLQLYCIEAMKNTNFRNNVSLMHHEIWHGTYVSALWFIICNDPQESRVSCLFQSKQDVGKESVKICKWEYPKCFHEVNLVLTYVAYDALKTQHHTTMNISLWFHLYIVCTILSVLVIIDLYSLFSCMKYILWV